MIRASPGGNKDAERSELPRPTGDFPESRNFPGPSIHYRGFRTDDGERSEADESANGAGIPAADRDRLRRRDDGRLERRPAPGALSSRKSDGLGSRVHSPGGAARADGPAGLPERAARHP